MHVRTDPEHGECNQWVLSTVCLCAPGTKLATCNSAVATVQYVERCMALMFNSPGCCIGNLGMFNSLTGLLGDFLILNLGLLLAWSHLATANQRTWGKQQATTKTATRRACAQLLSYPVDFVIVTLHPFGGSWSSILTSTKKMSFADHLHSTFHS